MAASMRTNPTTAVSMARMRASASASAGRTSRNPLLKAAAYPAAFFFCFCAILIRAAPPPHLPRAIRPNSCRVEQPTRKGGDAGGMIDRGDNHREGAKRHFGAVMTAPGVQEWFVREVLPLEAALVQYLQHNWRNRADVEDILQDVYVKV